MIKNQGGPVTENKIIRAALYARVSTDEQAERGTIEAQVHALRQTIPHWGMEIVDEYRDDGYSGTLPLEKRPGGLRLMDDAKAGKIDVVMFLKTDRLARSLRHLLDIVDYFEETNVTLRCVQEPFDTTNPAGRMMVHMMASFAEMERETILGRTSMGRERIAREGRWTGGVLPYGYHLSPDGYLIPAETPREGFEFSEVEIVRRIYDWIGDDHESAKNVARRLNADGIPAWKKFHKRGMAPEYRSSKSGLWWPSQIAKMVRSTTYRGEHTFNETVTRNVPALVSTSIWEKANGQLTANIRLSSRKNDHQYLLRGLIACAACGALYHGQRVNATSGGKPWFGIYYRCGSQTGDRGVIAAERCQAKAIRSDWLEELVWNDIKAFAANPGEVLDKLQERITDELLKTPINEERRKELERVLGLKEKEKDRVLDAYRRSLIDMDQLDEQIKRSNAETETLYKELTDLVANEIDTGITVGNLANTKGLLKTLRDTIGGELDWDTRRAVVEGLVSDIAVETSGTGHKKIASVTVSYNFSEPNCVVSNASSC